MPTPTGKVRLFFALMPAETAIEQIARLGARLKQEHQLTFQLLAKGRLHMTLDHLGDFVDFPHDIVKAACEGASSLSFPPFPVSLGHVVSFGRRQDKLPLVLKEDSRPNPDLASFRKALWTALAEQAVPGPSNAAFTPHITIFYDPVSVPERPVEPVEWIAQDFVFLRSYIGETRYEELGRWPLKEVAE